MERAAALGRSLAASVALTVLGVATGCASAPPPRATTDGARLGDERAMRARSAQFEEEETRILRAISTADPRIATRFGITPTDDELRRATLDALAAADDDDTENTSDAVATSGQSLDLFAFGARARMLSSAGEAVVRSTSELAEPARRERDLLRRLVVAERTRVERERALGVGAVALLSAMVASWTPPETNDAAKSRGRGLARRFGQIRASLSTAKLTLIERDAVDDALDPIERLVGEAGMSDASSAIAALRVTLGDVKTVATKAEGDDELARTIASAVGVTMPTKAVGDALTAAAARLRAQLDAQLAEVPTRTRDAMGADAARVLMDSASCSARVPESPVRAALPPPERAYARLIVCAFAAVRGGAAESTVALIVAHDLVAIALWAFDVHARGVDAYRAEEAHALLAPLPPEYATRRLRGAIADPAAALAGGMAVDLLARDGVAAMGARAKAWLAFGDAPLDAVAEALAVSPRGSAASAPAAPTTPSASAARSTATASPPRASLRP